MLLQGEPSDATVNFNTYQILQQHRAVFLPQHGLLPYISDRSICCQKNRSEADGVPSAAD